MLHRLQRDGRDAQPIGQAHRIAHQAHVAQVRHEAGLGLVVGMADLVANQRVLSRQLTTAGHGLNSTIRMGTGRLNAPGSDGGSIVAAKRWVKPEAPASRPFPFLCPKVGERRARPIPAQPG